MQKCSRKGRWFPSSQTLGHSVDTTSWTEFQRKGLYSDGASSHAGFPAQKQGNRLTRRPCKGDEFEIVIFEGKRENAGICRSRQKMCTTWTFISIGRRVTQG